MINALYNKKFAISSLHSLGAVLSFCLFFTCSNKNKLRMSEINIIPKPTYQKIESGNTNLLLIDKITTQTNSNAEVEIAKIVSPSIGV